MIREWTADRIPGLRQLWEALEVHHAALEGVPPVRALDDSWRRRQAQYREWLGDGSGHLFVYERTGDPVGYLMLRIGDDDMTSWDTGEPVATVETMAVLESERSTGVGKALIDAALAAAEDAGVQAVRVEVVHSNGGAIRFYERAGFKPFHVQLLRFKA